jgi:transcriptional regulator GlxA family with amidase domain/YHS domain-containing protein
MKRRDLLQTSAAFGLMMAAVPSLAETAKAGSEPGSVPNPLTPPAQGDVPVAFLLSEGAVVIDFAGPWEVFENVMILGRKPDHPFRLYTVAETTKPIRTSGGMKIVPDYTLASAPPPKVIVIPAQSDPTDAVLEWIRKSAKAADMTMSVCTGAFLLAKTGLLSGKVATTHHAAYQELAMDFPEIRVKRGARFVDSGNIATSGGLSSGIDLALHVVERYYGREVARNTAYQMEYQGTGWMSPDSNQAYLQALTSTEAHPLCPVCWMEVDRTVAEKSVYKGKNYYFCMGAHKTRFDSAPDKFSEAAKKP